MKRILATNPENWGALIARITLAVVVFPHGAQKLLGWFGGYGFTGTIHYLTGGPNVPLVIAVLVILIESIGALLVLAGFATRIAAFLVLCNFLGVMFHSHVDSGFFMNWYSDPNRGEGYEFFLLLFGLSLILMYTGGGKFSLDAAMTRPRIAEPPYMVEEAV